MFNIYKTDQWLRSRYGARKLAGAGLLTAAFFIGGSAQTGDQNTVIATTKKDPQTSAAKLKPAFLPVLQHYQHYKEVKIGSTADEVRDKLGKAKIDDKDGFYYRFNDSEFAQIRLDKNNMVRLISITYSGDNKNTPSYADVFGADAAVAAAKPDGSVYKLVRYPQAGYWVAYSRTSGNDPSVTITMQKIQLLK